jgi:hypothetical protein
LTETKTPNTVNATILPPSKITKISDPATPWSDMLSLRNTWTKFYSDKQIC